MKPEAKVTLLVPVLLTLVLLIAGGCAPSAPGSLDVDILASGTAVGEEGDLQISVREGSAGGVERQFHIQYDQLLVDGESFSWTFDDLAPGGYAVIAYLDNQPDGSLGPGDVIASAGAASVTVLSGSTVSAAVTLDGFEP